VEQGEPSGPFRTSEQKREKENGRVVSISTADVHKSQVSKVCAKRGVLLGTQSIVEESKRRLDTIGQK
jgi:hypothetical protein